MYIKKEKILREFGYYFLRLPFYSLSSSSSIYKKLSSWAEGKRVDSERKERVIQNLKKVFGSSINEKDLDWMAKKYFLILSCDDIDAYIQLFKKWNDIRKIIKVEGGEIFRTFTKSKKGCILLSAHYGGAFFIFNIIKEFGGKPQVVGRPIRREYFKGDPVRWAFLKLRTFSMEKAIGEKMIFTEGKETKREILVRLEKGYHIVITFDVPPIFTRGKIGDVHFLGRRWSFPLGFLELLIGSEFAILPFFTYMNDQWERIFKFYPPYWIEREEELLSSFQKSILIFENHIRKSPEQWFFWDDAQVFWERGN
jgi:lauroyl/myristoyl acyltransferase